MIRSVLCITLAAGLLAGCDRSTETTTAPPPSESTNLAWKLDVVPASYTQLGQTKTGAATGDTITVHGRIGGRVDPMMTEYASFIMADLTLQHCGQTGDDGCPTPWDYCCTPREDLIAGTASVQLMDESGEVLELDLTAHGFSPLDEVVVVGTVAERPAPDVFVIHATGIHRLRGG